MARCNGLFAFAALDSARRRVLLARDRFGVKPLYLARHGGAVWFASEIGALLAAGVAGAARPDVLAHAVGYGWAEGAQTPFAGIDRLAPGTLLDIDLETLAAAERRWYDPAAAVDRERMAALAEAGRVSWVTCSRRSSRSVRRRLMADVPVGTMCSGRPGLRLITALAREEHPRIVAYNAGGDRPAPEQGTAWASTSGRACARDPGRQQRADSQANHTGTGVAREIERLDPEAVAREQ